MVSWWEIVECVRVHGPMRVWRLNKMFDGKICKQIYQLVASGVLHRCEVVKTENGLEWRRLKRNETAKAVYIVVAPKLMKQLEKYGVSSFYDLPGAKKAEKEAGRKFIRFE